jgi:YidC/Oxa1 family membrane protein insertase
MIPLGWGIFGYVNKLAVIPLFDLLKDTGLGYGIIILILTLLIKTVLMPFTYKAYMSTAKMRVLKPEIEEINEKFEGKDDPMAKQQATMALYSKAGVNPMGGCLPMLFQMPILIALFRFFPASIELRQEPFLWADDLSSYDSILDLPFDIPFYGDHVSLFTLLMTISTILYTRFNMSMQAGSPQMEQMKWMMYLMPVMMLGWFNSYASGLSYYYFLANMVTFGQNYAFKFLVDDEAIHKKLQENKKKPKKQSGFQKRLEDMAKQRGYQQPAKKKKK